MSGQDFERRSRERYQESIDGLDMRIRSRLTQARHAALAAAGGAPARPRWMTWAPLTGATAALLLGVSLWVGHARSERIAIEDLDMVAANDQLEFLQDDPEFYDWVAKSDAGTATGASG